MKFINRSFLRNFFFFIYFILRFRHDVNSSLIYLSENTENNLNSSAYLPFEKIRI